MRNMLLKALVRNIIGLYILSVFYLLKYDINRTYTKEILLILFISEVSYWLTIVIGLLVIKKLKN